MFFVLYACLAAIGLVALLDLSLLYALASVKLGRVFILKPKKEKYMP